MLIVFYQGYWGELVGTEGEECQYKRWEIVCETTGSAASDCSCKSSRWTYTYTKSDTKKREYVCLCWKG